jgi:hypothetical protein
MPDLIAFDCYPNRVFVVRIIVLEIKARSDLNSNSFDRPFATEFIKTSLVKRFTSNIYPISGQPMHEWNYCAISCCHRRPKTIRAGCQTTIPIILH